MGCSASLTDAEKETQCKANLHIITSEWSWCWNGVKYLSTAFPDNGCHVSIPYKYWDQAVILNVTGYVDAVKNWWGRYSSIKFKSTTNPSDVSNTWNNMNIDHTVSVSTTVEGAVILSSHLSYCAASHCNLLNGENNGIFKYICLSRLLNPQALQLEAMDFILRMLVSYLYVSDERES